MFPSNLHYWASWAYSCLTAKKHYGTVNLVTDTDGEKIVKEIGLPYNNISTELNRIETKVPNTLWAYGKIVAYSIQNKPFIHIDGDAYFLDRLSSDLEDADVIVQNIEDRSNTSFDLGYHMSHLISQMQYKIDGWDKFNADKSALCLGIFGGKNLDAIKGYSDQVIKMVECDSNKAFWAKKYNWARFNVSIEQHAAYCYFKHHDVQVSPYVSMAEWENRFNKAQFSHLMSRKTNLTRCQKLIDDLKADFPEYYNRVNDLFGRA
jgi:hypothetical protein